MRIKLSARQAEMLDEMLANCMGELSVQIAATDDPGFRVQLLDRRGELATIKQALDRELSRSTGRILTSG